MGTDFDIDREQAKTLLDVILAEATSEGNQLAATIIRMKGRCYADDIEELRNDHTVMSTNTEHVKWASYEISFGKALTSILLQAPTGMLRGDTFRHSSCFLQALGLVRFQSIVGVKGGIPIFFDLEEKRYIAGTPSGEGINPRKITFAERFHLVAGVGASAQDHNVDLQYIVGPMLKKHIPLSFPLVVDESLITFASEQIDLWIFNYIKHPTGALNVLWNIFLLIMIIIMNSESVSFFTFEHGFEKLFCNFHII